jgi:hypothetical protein
VVDHGGGEGELYEFEVRRWPREADAAIAGVPEFGKKVDAWDPGGGKPTLVYAGAKYEVQGVAGGVRAVDGGRQGDR